MMKTVVEGRNYTDQEDESQSSPNSLHSCISFHSPFGYFSYISFHFVPWQHTHSAAGIFSFDLNKNEFQIPIQMRAEFPNIAVGVNCEHIKYNETSEIRIKIRETGKVEKPLQD